MPNEPKTPDRFYSLDAVRGIAALSVVFWHWQHFFYVGTELPSSFSPTQQPLFELFAIFYKRGWLAVDFFFSISGFIFYWLYSQNVAMGKTSIKEFFYLRFSRLYPLHLIILFLVAGLQGYFHSLTTTYFVYKHNNVFHFLLHLVFANSWGLERGESFNGPMWSISIEVLLYLLFFLLCRFAPVRLIFLLAISLLGFAVCVKNPLLGRGIISFFLGGSVFLIYRSLARHARRDTFVNLLSVLFVGAWTLTVVAVYGEEAWKAWPHFSRLLSIFIVTLVFPLTILTLALLETQRGTLGKRLAFLGDISYSSYLLHFPLQLIVVIIAWHCGIERDVFYSPLILAAFFGVLIPLSYLSYIYFERPAQRYLRRKLRPV